jgi:hypothetical protein
LEVNGSFAYERLDSGYKVDIRKKKEINSFNMNINEAILANIICFKNIHKVFALTLQVD